MKKNILTITGGFLFVFSVCFLPYPVQSNQNQYCPADAVECLDYNWRVWWCCPQGYECCYDYYGLPGYCCGTATTTISSTTTVPGTGTTTTIPGTATTTIPSTTTISGTGTTSTIPGTATTTTVPVPTVGDFIVGINVNGKNLPGAEPSGFLPGTSPQRTVPMFYRDDGRLIPFWYDEVRNIDIELVRESQKCIESRKSAQAAYALSIGEQKSFWVKDKNDATWRQVQATCQREGQHGLIFVDNSISVPSTALDIYVTEFDKMYAIVAANIGEFIDRDGNGKVAILFYDFNDGATANMYMAGYFWSKDYVLDSVASTKGIRSNEMDIIYIRGDEPQGWEQTGVDLYESLLTTLIHEYQHMVNFCITAWSESSNPGFSDVWINEMMSMITETLYFQEKLRENPLYTNSDLEGNGFLRSRIFYYNVDQNNSIRNGHGLTYWDNNGDTLANYSLSYLFGIYLATHASNGYGVFKQILDYMVAKKVYDYQAVTAVASQRIAGIGSWEDLLKSFAIANMANQPSGLFGYKGSFILTPHGPTLNSVRIHCGGAVYRMVTGKVSAPAGAGPNIRFFDDSGNPLPGGGGTCPASVALGEDTDENNTLRAFRDGILRQTPAGMSLIEEYYRVAPELAFILMGDQNLREQVKNLLVELQPALRTAVKNKRCSLAPNIEQNIDAVCSLIAQKASPELRDYIKKMQQDVASGKLFEELGIEKE